MFYLCLKPSLTEDWVQALYDFPFIIIVSRSNSKHLQRRRATMIGYGEFEPFTFGMILNLDIGLLHPSRLLRHKISQKKWKRPKKNFEGHIKDQIDFFFFALIWSNGLENSANVFGLTFKAIKTKKATKRPNIHESHIWKRRTQILLSWHYKKYL